MKKLFDGLMDKIAEKAAKQVVDRTKARIFGRDEEAPQKEADSAEERETERESKARLEAEEKQKREEQLRLEKERAKAERERAESQARMEREVDDELAALKKKLGKR